MKQKQIKHKISLTLTIHKAYKHLHTGIIKDHRKYTKRNFTKVVTY